jgi:hypothetical protein
MADDVSMIFFRSAAFNLDAAARALTDRGFTVRPVDDELAVQCGDGPELRVVFTQGEDVRDEATEIGEGTPHAEAMGHCDSLFAILIENLDEVLDEMNSLIEVQATLQDATQGFLFNTWNGEFVGPGE